MRYFDRHYLHVSRSTLALFLARRCRRPRLAPASRLQTSAPSALPTASSTTPPPRWLPLPVCPPPPCGSPPAACARRSRGSSPPSPHSPQGRRRALRRLQTAQGAGAHAQRATSKSQEATSQPAIEPRRECRVLSTMKLLGRLKG
ncbi:uncharacterized protein LOC120694967 [Panicum virgatum]|uniref:uncharacterized protein LOC120694967 n=1 Tax=Panicum virgatum TaxID=38727 RepID=UPI0019D5A52C|nr:uncharacterized protein LOC120694967 [Panicum virgatum]